MAERKLRARPDGRHPPMPRARSCRDHRWLDRRPHRGEQNRGARGWEYIHAATDGRRATFDKVMIRETVHGAIVSGKHNLLSRPGRGVTFENLAPDRDVVDRGRATACSRDERDRQQCGRWRILIEPDAMDPIACGEKRMSNDDIGDGLIKVSDLIIGHPEVRSFEDLKRLVVAAGRQGYRFLQFDIKPDFVDTPRNWDIALEAEFYRSDRSEP